MKMQGGNPEGLALFLVTGTEVPIPSACDLDEEAARRKDSPC